ncbi:hypothetical protein JRO89_XS13G0038900 [Xanthoceras sorbifolium]|uniref:Uncharacterized protein n=1 Tax=Xanthoceras sorbifolium TaxID=99658 RepID=A0ABQ8H6D7_9ROSI|nr:hypothetical protein JRO89_XS13G0038900 [Xanthoceras sorbifolium]
MDIFKSDRSESSTLSDADITRRASHSDEEVLLATSHPKKRAGRRVFKETRHPIYRGVRRRNTNKWRKSACLNFADSVWRLPMPASNDAKDIIKAAAEAAEAIRPRDQSVQVVSDQENIIAESSNTQICGGGYEEANTLLPENGFFMDEEAVFDMPGLLANMAEGLLLSPPLIVTGDDDHWDDGVSLDCGGAIDLAGLCWTCTGSMTVAAANSLNQVFEISNDAKMKRTMLRPLLSGRISISHAATWATSVGLAGAALLAYKTNMLTAVLAASNLCL